MSAGPFRYDDEKIRLRREAVRILVTNAGLSDREIASELGVTDRTVLRDRQALNLPPARPKHRKGVKVGSNAPHGTISRYTYDSCPCTPCRAAWAAYKMRENHETGRVRRYYVTCGVCGRRHAVDDPDDYRCTPNPTPRRAA